MIDPFTAVEAWVEAKIPIWEAARAARAGGDKSAPIDPNGAVDAWFAGLNLGDADMVKAHFAPVHRIRNAANPPIEGPRAVDDLLQEFFVRTSQRDFTVHGVAHSTSRAFARWTADITFADGATVAGHVVDEFTTTFDGIDVFAFDEHGRIIAVDIIHQTTTVALAAADHTRSS